MVARVSSPDPTGQVQRVLNKLERFRQVRPGQWMARCPAHEDGNPSLSVKEAPDGVVLLYCFGGCTQQAVVAALGMEMANLYPEKPSRYASGRRPPRVIKTTRYGIRDRNGELMAVHLRHDMSDGSKAMPWLHPDGRPASFADPLPGGPSGLPFYRSETLTSYGPDDPVIIVEGEKAADALGPVWPGPVLGTVTGAGSCPSLQAFEPLAGRLLILWPDNDAPGESHMACVAAAASESELATRRLVVAGLPSKGDAADYVAAGRTADELATLITAAPPFDTGTIPPDPPATVQPSIYERQEDILGLVDREVAASGVAGESRLVRLLYLVVTSRLLSRPVSVVVKGPSAGGKSFIVDLVLRLFPGMAYHVLTAMSERALAYDQEPLSHRMLVIYEAAGMSGDMASYLIRSLLSEGRLRYTTVVKTKDGPEAKLIERAGPTGLITTTTAVNLHPENETRLLSLTVTDTAEQTAAVMLAAAVGAKDERDRTEWHRLQEALATGERRVVIPYATTLARAIPPVAVRLRRDFRTILTLIEAHALLHRASRQRDSDGSIVATLADYGAVRGLVADLVADAVGLLVPWRTRETVATVATLTQSGPPATVDAVAARLKVDKSTASRRVRVAIERGYLRNLEINEGRPARLVLGEPLPEDRPILPSPHDLERLHGCSQDDGDGSGTQAS